MSQYTFLLDVSGRVCKETRGHEYLTCAGVAIESSRALAVRELIPPGLPKWSKAQDKDIEFVVALVNEHASSVLPLCVKKQQPLWSANWSDAEDYCRVLSSRVRQKVGSAKAAQFTRYMLFTECAGRLTAECLKADGFPRVLAPGGRGLVDVSVLCDSDIQGEDNVRVFKLIWEVFTSSPQSLLAQAGLIVSVRSVGLATEEEEPLLLLPDYVAGVFQAAYGDGAAFCSHSEVVVKAAADSLRGSGKAILVEKTFDIPYRKIYGKQVIGRELWKTPNTGAPPVANRAPRGRCR